LQLLSRASEMVAAAKHEVGRSDQALVQHLVPGQSAHRHGDVNVAEVQNPHGV
jgi:hypothetical protein